MALVVPIRNDTPAQPPGPMAAAAPPDPNFLLMAAAQMHKEGRLVKTAMDTSRMPMSSNIEDRRGEPTLEQIWKDDAYRNRMKIQVHNNPVEHEGS